jgi:hypothetical protein
MGCVTCPHATLRVARQGRVHSHSIHDAREYATPGEAVRDRDCRSSPARPILARLKVSTRRCKRFFRHQCSTRKSRRNQRTCTIRGVPCPCVDRFALRDVPRTS